MTDIPPPPTSAADPRPFDSGAPSASAGAAGCQKPLLVGCGVLTLLLGIGAIVFVMKAKDVLAFAMNQLRTQIASHLPEDLGEAERQRLETSFDVAIERIRQGKIDPAALQGLQAKLAAAAQRTGSQRMTPAEVAGLQGALDAFNGDKLEEPAVDPPPESAPDRGAEPPPAPPGG